jgi:lipid II:glycine glycyltransferase (peptidoglycan interpeptide bridge formation enzyme)
LNSYSKAASVGGPALTWHAIKWAKERGMRIYDFSGVLAPSDDGKNDSYREQWEGLTKYKRKWGGQEYPYYHFIKIIHPLRYKLFRLLTRPDWLYRDYKRKHFERPKIVD